MSNSASKQQCKRKRQMAAIEKEHGRFTVLELFASSATAEYNKISDEFCHGPMRHGNNRKMYARTKVKQRRSDRRKNNQGIEYDTDD